MDRPDQTRPDMCLSLSEENKGSYLRLQLIPADLKSRSVSSNVWCLVGLYVWCSEASSDSIGSLRPFSLFRPSLKKREASSTDRKVSVNVKSMLAIEFTKWE